MALSHSYVTDYQRVVGMAKPSFETSLHQEKRDQMIARSRGLPFPLKSPCSPAFTFQHSKLTSLTWEHYSFLSVDDQPSCVFSRKLLAGGQRNRS